MTLGVLLLLAFLASPLGAQDFCIIFSGEERGYLEPCGCTRPQSGGIAKRHTFIESLSEPSLTISLGDLVDHVRRQDELKAETFAQALTTMGYSLHNLGERDLTMGLDTLAYLFPSGSVSLLSSNIQISNPIIELAPFIVQEVTIKEKTVKIGFLGILSPTLVGLQPSWVQLIPPEEALRPLIEKLKNKVDLLVLLSHAPMEESLALAKNFPEFHLVASGHNTDQPTIIKEGKTWVFTPGIKGKFVVLYRYNPTSGSGKLETVSIGESFKDSSLMLALLDSYQERLKGEDLLSKIEKISVSEKTSYAGSQTCSPCHLNIFKHWSSTSHAAAYETLLKVGRAFDPECVVCHVIGLSYIGGFESQEKSPGLTGVGCEACHGPGSSHISQILQNLNPEKYGKTSPEICTGCHDPEHDPPFQFDPYWNRIKHPAELPAYPTATK